MGIWTDFGMKTLGSLVEGGINAGFKELDRARNFHWNEKAADAADKRQRAQFQDLYSYPAQIGQMREAGLSPSLMYAGGAGGQGGATAPQGLGAGGVQAGYTTLDPMTKTQIDLAESQTKLNNAEANNLESKTENQEIQNYIDNLSKDTSIEERKQNLQVLIALGTKYLSETSLNIATRDKTQWENTWNQIKSNEELNNLRYQNALYIAQIGTENSQQTLNEQQTETLAKQIDKWQMDVTQRYYELDIASWHQQAQENWWLSQTDYMINYLEFENKRLNLNLDFSNKELWVNNLFNIGKSAIIATGMVFTRGGVNVSVPKVSFGQPKPIGFK